MWCSGEDVVADFGTGKRTRVIDKDGIHGHGIQLWLVYLQFRGTREKLQGGFLELFNLFFGQFSVNFRDEFSGKNP